MALILDLYGEAPESIVDGPGLRYSIFVQGCPHHCPGCHNPQSHSFGTGYKKTTDELLSSIKENPLLAGVTFSGGEPFCQAEALCELARAIKALGLNIYIYSGYTIEQLLEKAVQNPFIKELLYTCDTLIDGPYIEQQRNLDLLFRGSENQRIIDLHTWPGLKN